MHSRDILCFRNFFASLIRLSSFLDFLCLSCTVNSMPPSSVCDVPKAVSAGAHVRTRDFRHHVPSMQSCLTFLTLSFFCFLLFLCCWLASATAAICTKQRWITKVLIPTIVASPLLSEASASESSEYFLLCDFLCLSLPMPRAATKLEIAGCLT